MKNNTILSKINSPKDLNDKSISELNLLSNEIAEHIKKVV